MRRTYSLLLAASLTAVFCQIPAAHALTLHAPDWVKPALRYVVSEGYFSPTDFHANDPMTRRSFKRLMERSFGGGYRRTRGTVTAGEVGGSLVRALGFKDLASSLSSVTSPDGWDPELGKRFGTEVVSRELGLRHDRPTDEEMHEASASEPITQGDAIWAVWKAKTAPDEYAAEALSSFSLANYGAARRKVVKFALSLVGTPYIYGGEWLAKTPVGYPYGPQSVGGVDCSGFAWYVLQAKSSSYSPAGRHYQGWSIAERSAADMAKAAPKRLKFGDLKPADLVFFAEGGRDAHARDVYHTGIYLGGGWMIHSSGSRDGISLANIGAGSWWRDQIFGGRRIVTNRD
ncbi:MAG: peptidoglycan DL-endopeptidase CwlO [Actinomycetota bacterium]|nr:peptidoglycan DL-endopeptidase CwlO [Actinomycetota bacterium]